MKLGPHAKAGPSVWGGVTWRNYCEAVHAERGYTGGDMTLTGDAMFERRPLYVALFSAAEDTGSPYLPFVVEQVGRDSAITVPHAFDREVAAALPGLWYCMHLPNDFGQLIDVPAATIKASQALHLDHHILAVPIQVFDQDHIGGWLAAGAAACVVCPDDLIVEAAQRSTALGFPLPVAAHSELSNESLRAHWQAIHAHFVPNAPYLGQEPTLLRRLDLAPTDLPRRWLARQMRGDPESRFVVDGDLHGLMGEALWHQVVLAAIARLEREHATPEIAEQRMPQVIEEEQARLRVPVALALPGVSSVYSRNAYEKSIRDRIQSLAAVDEADTWSVAMDQRSDALVERAAIEFVTTHRAVARTGVGLMLPSAPQEAFTILAELERHFLQTPRGPTVWQLLKRLDDVAQPIWSETLVETMKRASMLTVFSNFPIGLLRLAGDTAPLLTRLPIAYRPLLPLTRTVQIELTDVPAIDLSSRFRVLVAEAIPADDPVGRLSRSGWKFAEDFVREEGPPTITLEFVETLSVDALRGAIAEKQPDFLVISAHGRFDRRGNVAGLMVGDEFCLGPGLGPLPPVVILSACHVAPRGAGAVSITDMLLREGAVAVLGTQVPVDVAHNAMLMARFFVYIMEVLAQREEHSTLLEVWHRVQTSNAINDVLSGSPSLHSWGRSLASSGRPVLVEFMSVRSTGRLRMGHIYEDTERVLAEIADEQGNGERVRNWFKSPGYVPESLFYVFAGRPERIYLRPVMDDRAQIPSR